MPLVSSNDAAPISERRCKGAWPPLSGACVARPVSRPERLRTPAALKAMDKEWDRLRNIKHATGVGVWDESAVEERSAVVARAKASGEVYHFVRIF